MTSKLKLLAAASAVSMAMLGANPALAEGTTAGTDILNEVSVSYSVGGVAQADIDTSDTFKVDRKINLNVTEATPTGTTSVAPGETGAVTVFTVTNLSNEVLDFQVTASQLAGGTAEHGGTDNFDLTGLQVFVDTNGNGTYEPGIDTDTYVDELGEDASITVFVVGDVPAAQANGSVACVVLTATAREGGAAGAPIGALITESAGGNTANVETVFADGAGETDGARDAAFSAGDDYTVAAANLSVVKFSTVISDPVNGTTNPKAIPGATIEYCIGIENAAGAATATGLSISDTLPGNITYEPSFGVKINGTYTSGATPSCTAGTDDGTFASNTASSGTTPGLDDVAAGGNTSLVFRATVD